MNLTTMITGRSRFFWMAVGFLLVILVGIVDFVTGYEIAFSLFYLLPISLVVWFVSKRIGFVVSMMSVLTWALADISAGQSYSHPGIYYWNTAIRLGFFFIVTLLVSTLRRFVNRESELARTDYLTGAINTRYFYDLLQLEIDRFQRYQRPFTLAYIDLDNFKQLNDQFGHLTGDQVLCSVVQNTEEYLRKSDIIARLGGDEFVILLPETGSEAASAVINRLQRGLLDEMHSNHWPVTFSIGVLTCLAGVNSPDEALKLADDLMYSAKRNSKNAVAYSVYPG